MRCSCGSDWFVEKRIVRPAGLPSEHQHVPMPLRDHPRYVYDCASCGTTYGEVPRHKPGPKPKSKTN